MKINLKNKKINSNHYHCCNLFTMKSMFLNNMTLIYYLMNATLNYRILLFEFRNVFFNFIKPIQSFINYFFLHYNHT